jgi:tetratricopeptide (TPR) repeat protein
MIRSNGRPRAEADPMDYESPLRRHLREALQADPASAYRDWFRAQEELRESGRADAVCALAEDLWELLPTLPFFDDEARARFFHNVGVFYGSPGPGADLGRARRAFGEALEHFRAHDEAGWRARALHNLGTAVSSLGATADELAEAIRLFEAALEWRTSEREIARGVTLHNLGSALLRRAELDPTHSDEHLEAAARAFEEAVAIRERNRLAEGCAASQRGLEAALRARERAARGGSEPGDSGEKAR